jgi:BRCA1-associated protein
VCHVVFIKSITFEVPSELQDPPSGPQALSRTNTLNTLKPLPPPTPDLVELPTCPVCLERMDDTTGLMTIPCQHIFHCSCLQTWSGSGCPVCRYTSPADPDSTPSRPFGASADNLCNVCDETEGLWICLICGNVACGRYKGAHAMDHYRQTAHCFALEIESQHVWDYAGDTWVHRLIREKGEGKIVELPSSNRAAKAAAGAGDDDEPDMVPRSKYERMGLEYTHLLTSQLESQRMYFEELMSKFADKMSKSASGVEKYMREAELAMKQCHELQDELTVLKGEKFPRMEQEVEKLRARADRSHELARSAMHKLQEERSLTEGLMDKIEHSQRGQKDLLEQVEMLQQKLEEQLEMNRDLTMYISGQEKLREMEAAGALEEGEAASSSVGVAGENGQQQQPGENGGGSKRKNKKKKK